MRQGNRASHTTFIPGMVSPTLLYPESCWKPVSGGWGSWWVLRSVVTYWVITPSWNVRSGAGLRRLRRLG